MLVVRNLGGGIPRSLILDGDIVVHAARPTARLLSETSAERSAHRIVHNRPMRLDIAVLSIAQLQVDAFTQPVIAIGPSTASIISASVIAAAGRASLRPPPAPRTERSKSALVKMLTSFCTVGKRNAGFRSPVPSRTYASRRNGATQRS